MSQVVWVNIETRARCKSSSQDDYSAQFVQFSEFLTKRREKILPKKTLYLFLSWRCRSSVRNRAKKKRISLFVVSCLLIGLIKLPWTLPAKFGLEIVARISSTWAILMSLTIFVGNFAYNLVNFVDFSDISSQMRCLTRFPISACRIICLAFQLM